jgi:hypothetical protein
MHLKQTSYGPRKSPTGWIEIQGRKKRKRNPQRFPQFGTKEEQSIPARKGQNRIERYSWFRRSEEAQIREAHRG